MTGRIAIVGGGIAGLAALHELIRSGHDDVVLLEVAEQVGGKIRSSEVAGRIIDEGGDAFLARVPWATELAREIGLEDQLISPHARNAFIWSDGNLHPLPQPHVLGIPTDPETVGGGLLSDQAVEDLKADLARTEADPVLTDDTVGSLVRRRVGDEVFEKLVNPLIGAINAGDTDHMSLAASAPQFAAAADAHPSLIAGLLETRSAPDPDAPVFHSFATGLTTLTNRLADLYEPWIQTGINVFNVEKKRKKLRLEAEGEAMDVQSIIMATPAHVSAPIVGEWRRAAEAMKEIDYVSVVLVTLAYKARDVETVVPGGSGFLVPSGQSPIITACSWSSSKWAHLAPETAVGGDDPLVYLRVSLGRAGADAVTSARDADIMSTVKLDLSETMNITADPRAVRISRWPKSFPQYALGHAARVATIRESLATANIFVAGAAYDGIGVPACINSGRTAARAAVAALSN